MLALVHEAVRSSPDDPEVIASAAHVMAWAGAEYEDAVQLSERALAVAGNSAFVLMQVGSALFHSGRWTESVGHFERALTLDPLDPMGFSIRAALAHVCIALEEDSRAIELATRAVQQNPRFAWAWRVLAAAQALSGQLKDATDALREMLKLDPTWKLSDVTARTPGGEINHQRLVEGLRLLGAGD